ncbi:MAG TPA: MFS transporter [Nonomuraea sp.]|nr:MFS transporter [Nonomuraea sp.]
MPNWSVRRRPSVPPAFRHRAFRLYIGSQAISLLGTQMQNLGQVWLVLVLTRDPLLVGLLTAAQGLPIVTLSLFGGVIADRFPKRRILLATQSTMLVLALVLGALTLSERIEVWQVFVLAVALGTANALEMPARQTFVVEMVGRDDLGSAVGLFSALYSSARIVGPAVAGIAIAALTQATGSEVAATGAVFAINALTFASVIIGLSLIRQVDLHQAEHAEQGGRERPSFGGMLDGVRYLRTARPVLVTLLVPALIAIIAVNSGVLVPIYGQEAMLGVTEVGLLLSAVGAGALGGALWIGVGGASGPLVLVRGAALLGMATLLLGIVAAPLAWPVLLFGAGLGGSAMRTAANTQIQLATPTAVRGRVMAVFSLLYEGASPIGGLVAGGIAALGGARLAYVITGATAVLVLGLGAGQMLSLRQSAPRETT